MDDSVAMRVDERARDLDRVGERHGQRHRSARQPHRQRVAFEILHDEVVDLVLTSDVVQRADVRVGEGSNRPRFAGEPYAQLRIRPTPAGSTLMATWRLSRVSVPRKTLPMPPAPRGPSMR